MTASPTEIWLLIALLGLGTYLIRFSFLGLIGNRKMPDWLLRHLRYTSVAVLPGLVAPLVLWPAATDGSPDPARLAAAAAALGVGYLSKGFIFAFVAGAGTLYAGLYILG